VLQDVVAHAADDVAQGPAVGPGAAHQDGVRGVGHDEGAQRARVGRGPPVREGRIRGRQGDAARAGAGAGRGAHPARQVRAVQDLHQRAPLVQGNKGRGGRARAVRPRHKARAHGRRAVLIIRWPHLHGRPGGQAPQGVPVLPGRDRPGGGQGGPGGRVTDGFEDEGHRVRDDGRPLLVPGGPDRVGRIPGRVGRGKLAHQGRVLVGREGDSDGDQPGPGGRVDAEEKVAALTVAQGLIS